jgi:hypothetical protein
MRVWWTVRGSEQLHHVLKSSLSRRRDHLATTYDCKRGSFEVAISGTLAFFGGLLDVHKEAEMAKSLLLRLFGVGRIPAALMFQLQSEGIVLLDEGVKASVTYRNFSAPGKRFGWRRQWFAGSIAMTRTLAVLRSNHQRSACGPAHQGNAVLA